MPDQFGHEPGDDKLNDAHEALAQAVEYSLSKLINAWKAAVEPEKTVLWFRLDKLNDAFEVVYHEDFDSDDPDEDDDPDRG